MYSNNVKHQRAKRYQQLRKEINKSEIARNGYFTDGNYQKLREEYYSICMYADHHCHTCEYETWRKRYSSKSYRTNCKTMIRTFLMSGKEDLILPEWNKYKKSF